MANIKQINVGGTAYDLNASALNFVHTNEILIGNTNAQSSIHINHRRVKDGAVSGNTAITDYYFKNGNAATTGVTIHAGTFNGALTGNASTATKLATARTINGTSFDGSANITTANWGTTRTLTIGSTGKSVNGSANVSWSLSEIGAAAANHNHDSVYVQKNPRFSTEKGTNPSSNAYISWAPLDKTGSANGDRLALIESGWGSNGNSWIGMHAYSSASGSTNKVYIECVYPASGEPYVQVSNNANTGNVVRNIRIGTSKPADSTGSNGELFVVYVA